MRLDKLRPGWVRAGLILATGLVYAWHVAADFDDTLGAISFLVSCGLPAFELRRRASHASTPAAGPPPSLE